MALARGEQVGPYEVLSALGAGGMGEVFRARDTRLGREVALKVIAGAAAEPERVRRFELEARAAGALNHPNVLALYDVGTHGGAPYLVTELLEGETLRERLSSGRLPVRKALEFAIQISHGLSAAHEKDIVHRDLKPANLFVTRDGRVKILDFGLAKLVGTEPPATEGTLTEGTLSGAVLGTVGYMAPEQVRGKPADARSDLFSLGVVLFEMLSGQRAFGGGTPVEVGYATLTGDPAQLPPEVPAPLARLVRRCLEKAPEQRFQSARDLAFALEALLEDSSGATGKLTALPAPGWRLPVAAGLVGALVATAAVYAMLRPPPTPTPVSSRPAVERASELPSFRRVTFRAGEVTRARFAPDGKTIHYAATFGRDPVRVFSTSSEGPVARGTSEPGVTLFAVASTGELAVGIKPGLVFREPTTLSRLSADGATSKAVLEDVLDADWSPDGTQLAVVHKVGDLERLEFPIGNVLHETRGWIAGIRVSPDGQLVSFEDHPVVGDGFGRVRIVDRKGTERARSEESWGVTQTAWTADGREVWFGGAEKGAVSMSSVAALSVDGGQRVVYRSHGSFVVLEDVARDGRVLIVTAMQRIQMAGTFPSRAGERDLSWLDGTLVRGLSADGSTVLFGEAQEAGGFDYSIFLRRTDGAPPINLGTGNPLALSADGQQVLAGADIACTSLIVVPAGAGERRVLPPGPIVQYQNSNRGMAAWSPDGKQVYFAGTDAAGLSRTWVQDLAGGPPRPVTPGGWVVSAISPDGKLLVASSKGQLALFPVSGGEPRPVPGALPDDRAVGFGTGGKVLYLLVPSAHAPWQLDRVQLDSGKREPWRTLPGPSAGVFGLDGNVVITPDGASYAYSYVTALSDLYVIRGLR